MKTLDGRVAVVTGATRGAGRGIACMLGEAGATVYCTGRSSGPGRMNAHQTGDAAFRLDNRPETIEETAQMVNTFGGTGIPVQVDHTMEEQVRALFARVRTEQGRLDILVDDVWGGDELSEWGKPFWELDLEKGRLMLERAIWSHIITARYAAPLLLAQGRGLVVEVTDGDNFSYRGNLFYDLVKISVIRLAYAISVEFAPHNITALAVTPGFLRSEAMLDHFGVTEANWQEAVKQDPHFIASETPFYVGRAVAALASDANVSAKSGNVYSSWNLALEYGFTDMDGRQPNWGKYFKENISK